MGRSSYSKIMNPVVVSLGEQREALLAEARGSRHVPVREGRPAERMETRRELALGVSLTHQGHTLVASRG
jgi:hypothetical protein